MSDHEKAQVDFPQQADITTVNCQHDQSEISPPYIGCALNLDALLFADVVEMGIHHRNSRDRPSDFIADRHVDNLLAATEHAEAISLPLNSFRTIHFATAGLESDHEALGAFTRFKRMATSWLRAKGSSTTIIWVREAGPGHGQHVHLLVHIPATLAKGFAARQQRWLNRCGGKRARGVFKSVVVGDRRLDDAFGDTYQRRHYRINLANVVGYMLKGACWETARRLGLARCDDQGTILGKRSGTSQNIGRAARGNKQASRAAWAMLIDQLPLDDVPAVSVSMPCVDGEHGNEGLAALPQAAPPSTSLPMTSDVPRVTATHAREAHPQNGGTPATIERDDLPEPP